MGFDNACIIDLYQYPGEYFCPLCQTLVYPNEALQSQCTHLYCKSCLTYVANYGTRACPHDGYSVAESNSKPLVESDKALAEKIWKIKVRCLYVQSGCAWEGALSESISHCSGCSFGNWPFVCNRCGLNILHKQAKEHAYVCPQRRYVAQQAAPGGVNATGLSANTAQTSATYQQPNGSSQTAVVAPLAQEQWWYHHQYPAYHASQTRQGQATNDTTTTWSQTQLPPPAQHPQMPEYQRPPVQMRYTPSTYQARVQPQTAPQQYAEQQPFNVPFQGQMHQPIQPCGPPQPQTITQSSLNVGTVAHTAPVQYGSNHFGSDREFSGVPAHGSGEGSRFFNPSPVSFYDGRFPSSFDHHLQRGSIDDHMRQPISNSREFDTGSCHGMRNNYTDQVSRNALNLKGGLESLDLSRRRPTSIGWCRLCQVDCETIDELEMHSQSREHQNICMDIVKTIKQQNHRASRRHISINSGSFRNVVRE